MHNEVIWKRFDMAINGLSEPMVAHNGSPWAETEADLGSDPW